MKKTVNERLWPYVGRFSLVHLMTYTIISIAFLIIQNGLPASERVALDFFKPYPSVSIMVILTQFIRGSMLALILYPFYNRIVRSKHGGWILFGTIWGLTLLGSVEPMPGSIEGFIYTETTIFEHFGVLIAGAVQISLFAWIFLRWEKWSDIKGSYTNSGGDMHE